MGTPLAIPMVFGLDFMQQVPVFGFMAGVLIALLCNQFWQPVDEVLMIIAGLLTIKASLCLIPDTAQRFAPDGNPLHSAQEETRGQTSGGRDWVRHCCFLVWI